jgi:hypothetical protein
MCGRGSAWFIFLNEHQEGTYSGFFLLQKGQGFLQHKGHKHGMPYFLLQLKEIFI